jgi:hypothetical protein
LIEDYIHLKDSNETATNECLIHLEEFFQQQRLSCTTVLGHKYKPNFEITHNNQTFDVLEEKKLGIEHKSKLNTEQNIAVTTILKAVENEKIEKKAFFIDGPGGKLLFLYLKDIHIFIIIISKLITEGTGKTFVYNTLTRILRGNK